MRWLPAVAAAALLGPAAAAHAQDVCAQNLTWPAVGKWAEYDGTYNEKTPVKTRYAVVGRESRNGTEYKWIELKMHDEQHDKDMVYQMLVPGGPMELDQVQDVVMKMGTEPAMKMSGMMMKLMRGQLSKNSAFKDACTGVTLVGSETVTVPAGRFTTKHFHSDTYETDSWVDPALSFSMVKSQGRSHQIQLVATGDGAKSSITETPREMGGP